MAEIDTGKAYSCWEIKGEVDYVDDWFLMSSPFPVLLILGSYLYFVLRCGPKFMQNRPAYELRNIILLYNVAQVAYSLYMFIKGSNGIYEFGLVETKCITKNEKTLRRCCAPGVECILLDKTADIQKNPRIVFLMDGYHLYLMAKFSELLDTVFFVLRKKVNQVSFLHVYHHSIMFIGTWIVMKYSPTCSMLFIGTLNSFVHVIMYTYYGLASFPELAKYLWWKKYITTLQLIQFFLALIQSTWTFFVTECPPSYLLLLTIWFHFVIFTYMFTKFYIQTYIQSKKYNANNIRSRKQDNKIQ